VTNGDPFFSILIPTRDRAEMAGECVAALLAQGHPSFEILVLDQSAGDEAASAVERAAQGRANVRVVRLTSAGRSRALNAGIPLACGEWIVMTDDDCEPATGWLAALEEEARRAPARTVIVGRVLPGEVPPGMGVPPSTIEDPEPADYEGRVRRDLVYPNIALPRRAFDEVGLFDVRMGVGTPLPGGEDNDFGYRLLRGGWRILYRPGPAVIHRAWRPSSARLAQKRDYGLGQGAFYAKHLARLDAFIAGRLVSDLLRNARAAGGAALRGQGQECLGHLKFLYGMLAGTARMVLLMLRGARGEDESPGERAQEALAGETGPRRSAGRIVEIDLSRSADPPNLAAGGTCYVLFRWKGRPVGRVIVDARQSLSAEAFRREAIEASAAGLIAAEIEQSGPGSGLSALRAVPGAEPATGRLMPAEISVVIASRDRPEELSDCLAALGRLNPAPGEVVVVDSASARREEVAATASRAGARLVRVDRPGLSRARNAGAVQAKGKVIAFLDDDCRVDAGWLTALCAGFTDDGVEAVTGQLLPSQLLTEAQRWFLLYSHMDRRGFTPRWFDRREAESAYWPVDAWRMGSGGNLAVRSDAFERCGGFSLALGLGTPARGGEDLFLLWSLIRAGGSVVYRPDAMAWHRHHSSMKALREVLFGYGAGHAAYLRAIRAAGESGRTLRRYRLMFTFDRFRRCARSMLGLSPVPASLVLRELAGSLAGGRLGRRAELEAAREEAYRKQAVGSDGEERADPASNRVRGLS
jgi:GT2 family glycosyltransferase